MKNEIGGQIELDDSRLNDDIGNFDSLEVEDSGNWSEAVAKENMNADGLGDDDIKVFEMMVNELNGNIGRPMNLRFVKREKLRDFTFHSFIHLKLFTHGCPINRRRLLYRGPCLKTKKKKLSIL